MRKHREFLFPDLTPLIDVVFLLLIFFLVSSVLKKEDFALLLNLPKAEYSVEKVNSKDINIYVTKDMIYLEEKKLELNLLDITLSKIENKMRPVNVRIDKEVKYQKVMTVLDLLKKNDLSNLALVNEKD